MEKLLRFSMHTVYDDRVLAGLHQFMGNEIARQNLIPHPASQFVTAVNRLGSVIRHRFKKEMTTLGPQGVCMLPRDQLRWRYCTKFFIKPVRPGWFSNCSCSCCAFSVRQMQP